MTGAVALVTGGGRGIGRSTAELLVSRGMTVVAVSRTERELRSLKDSVGADYIVASVETEQACESIVDETLRRHGRVDVLVNNAGSVELSVPSGNRTPPCSGNRSRSTSRELSTSPGSPPAIWSNVGRGES